jgi:Flp pilus assembly protein TadG
MAILLWDLVIAAAFVFLAVGALAYLLVNLLLAGIKKRATIVAAYDQRFGRRILSRPELGRYGRKKNHYTTTVLRKRMSSPSSHKRTERKTLPRKASGQALVEFTLTFVLFLAIIWIPADFGLAFFSGQLAQNASREGARLAAATNPFDAANIQTQVMNRMESAVLKNVTADVVPPACDPALNMQVVTVTVAGEYNFYFYQLLRLLGVSAPDNVAITRTTTMRYEYGFSC